MKLSDVVRAPSTDVRGAMRKGQKQKQKALRRKPNGEPNPSGSSVVGSQQSEKGGSGGSTGTSTILN